MSCKLKKIGCFPCHVTPAANGLCEALLTVIIAIYQSVMLSSNASHNR